VRSETLAVRTLGDGAPVVAPRSPAFVERERQQFVA
jgi:hypothetical protein